MKKSTRVRLVRRRAITHRNTKTIVSIGIDAKAAAKALKEMQELMRGFKELGQEIQRKA